MEFLFEPSRVERRLQRLPAIAQRVPAPATEGTKARVEPADVRKSQVQIYRLLGNAWMPHLRPALLAIENAVGAGVGLPELFSAERHDQFSSHLTEAIAADHFLLKDFTVTKLPRTHQRSADLVVSDGSLDATIEIYSPREWEALADWETALWDTVNNLDVPQVFRASVNTRAEFGSDPWSIARALRQTGDAVLTEIEADLYELLAGGGTSFQKTYDHAPYPIETEVEFEVVAASGHYRGRFIAQGGPTITGHAPEGMFNRIVSRKVKKKAKRRQAQSGAARLRGLIVDLHRTQIADVVRDEPYKTRAEKSASTIQLDAGGLDFVAFCGRSLWRRNRPRRGLFPDIVIYEDKRMSGAEVERLLRPVD